LSGIGADIVQLFGPSSKRTVDGWHPPSGVRGKRLLSLPFLETPGMEWQRRREIRRTRRDRAGRPQHHDGSRHERQVATWTATSSSVRRPQPSKRDERWV